MRSYFFIVCVLSAFLLNGQSKSAMTVLSKSITYHDPSHLLQRKAFHFDILETRPDGEDRQSSVHIDVPKEFISVSRDMDGHKVYFSTKKNKVSFSLDGRDELTSEEIKEFRLTEERAHSILSYYRYLWHMPLSFTDAGSIVHVEAPLVTFNGQQCYRVKVTYAPEVGSDTWYGYFAKDNYALIGYQFYHDESANDGEYIYLSGEVKYKSMRIPQRRDWYTNQDNKLLGTDSLLAISKCKSN